MYYQIVGQPETEEQSGLTYTVVRFWLSRADYVAGKEPVTTEDFLSDLRETATRIVTDAQGRYKLSDGTFIAPAQMDPETAYEFERETVQLDPVDQLLENIERFLDGNRERIERGQFPKSRVNRQIRVKPATERSAVAKRSDMRDLRESRWDQRKTRDTR